MSSKLLAQPRQRHNDHTCRTNMDESLTEYIASVLLFDGHRSIACAHILLCFVLLACIDRIRLGFALRASILTKLGWKKISRLTPSTPPECVAVSSYPCVPLIWRGLDPIKPASIGSSLYPFLSEKYANNELVERMG